MCSASVCTTIPHCDITQVDVTHHLPQFRPEATNAGPDHPDTKAGKEYVQYIYTLYIFTTT